MKPVEPIHTVELFPPLSHELMTVLKSLQPSDWDRLTICIPWTVKDLAAHLLGGSLSRLGNREEASAAPREDIRSYDELLALINSQNDLWVEAARRISPEVLIEFLELTDRHLYDHFRRLPSKEPATLAVAWAGDSSSPNWFDIAREYTEKWLHQQQIREAVGVGLLTDRKWLFPVLDTFVRGLPHNYRHLEASEGTSVSVQITGEAGGEWTLVREHTGWQLFTSSDPRAACQVRIDQDSAWRLFTKGVPRAEARQRVQVEGNLALGEPVLDMVSIMA